MCNIQVCTQDGHQPKEDGGTGNEGGEATHGLDRVGSASVDGHLGAALAAVANSDGGGNGTCVVTAAVVHGSSGLSAAGADGSSKNSGLVTHLLA
ncbi:hypothetical protein KCU92_g51, partial [Aureobasidium melanogenum]